MQITVNRNGKTLKVNPKVAKVLIARGIASAYETRDMRADAAPNYTTTAIQEPATAKANLQPAADSARQPIAESSDGLDELAVDELHSIAKERGIEVHHRAGADKVRAALRGLPE